MIDPSRDGEAVFPNGLPDLAEASPAFQRAVLNKLYSCDFDIFNRRVFDALEGQPLGPSWHHQAIAHVLQEVAAGRIKRLLITMPPRSLKSQMVSVAFPAWLHGLDPRKKILCTSYNEDLAVSFANGWRSLLVEPWYRSAFPDTRISTRKNREAETLLTAGGHRLSLPAGGALTGRGADLIIIDDPLKASDAYSDAARTRINNWFGQTVVTRLNNKFEGAIIVVMQRLHPDDLAGKLIEGGGWHHLNLPAIGFCDTKVQLTKGRVYHWAEGEILQPQREPQHVLDAIKADMGARDFGAQYMQMPVAIEGSYIKLKYFRRLDETDLRCVCGEYVISIDTANTGNTTSDFSVIQVWRINNKDKQFDLIAQRRGQWDYPQLKSQTAALSEIFNHPRILIEKAGVGYALVKDLAREGCSTYGITPKDSKEQRVMRVLPAIESERIGIPERADWISDFTHEVAAFPAGKHDDQVDAMTQFILWVTEKRIDISMLKPLRIGA